MECLDCHNPLQTVNFQNITVEECPHCHGRWFDQGELKKAKDSADPDLHWIDFDPFTKAQPQEKSDTPEGLLCPACQTEMVSCAYNHSDIFIDKCPGCKGVWLHHDEFEKIIAYLEGVLSTASAAELTKDSFQQFSEVLRQKKDISTGMQDFLLILKLLRNRIGVEHPHLSESVNKIFEYLPFL